MNDDPLSSRDAEAEVCGWMIAYAAERHVACRDIGPGDFVTEYARVYAVLSETNERLSVAELAQRARVGAETIRHAIAASSYSPLPAMRVLAGLTMRRNLRAAGKDFQRIAHDQVHSDEDVLEEAQGLWSMVRVPTTEVEISEDVGAFVDHPEIEAQFVIPGVVEVGDRIIITAGEGVGKSTFQRQFVTMAAAGLHPFRPTTIEPVRCLIVDLESRTPMVRRKLRTLVNQAHAEAEFDPRFLRVESRPSGMDLTKRADRAWLAGKLQAFKPQIVAFGPLYKAYVGDMREEESARQVAEVLDDYASRFECAWLLETHAPHGDGHGKRPLRPFGSSLWLRWPEMGIGFRDKGDSIEIEYWRRPRDERDWPQRFVRGGKWPWTANWLEAV